MELEYAKELDRVLRTLQGSIPKRFFIGSDALGTETITEIKKEAGASGTNKYLIVIRGWDVNNLCEELELSRVVVCGYLEVLGKDGFVHLLDGPSSEIYSSAEIKVSGIHFLRNGGYMRIATEELNREKKKQEIIEKQLEAAINSSEAADKTARYTKYLLGVTALNVLIVLFTTVFPSEKEKIEPKTTEGESATKEEATNVGKQAASDSLAYKNNFTMENDSLVEKVNRTHSDK